MYIYIWIYGVESVPCGLISAGWRRRRLPECCRVVDGHGPSGQLGVTHTRASPVPYIQQWSRWWENRDVRSTPDVVIYAVRIDKTICAPRTTDTTTGWSVSRVISMRTNRSWKRDYYIARYEPDTTIPPPPSGRDSDTPVRQYIGE